MKAEGQAGDQGTNSSNTHKAVVALEVEFMVEFLWRYSSVVQVVSQVQYRLELESYWRGWGGDETKGEDIRAIHIIIEVLETH